MMGSDRLSSMPDTHIVVPSSFLSLSLVSFCASFECRRSAPPNCAQSKADQNKRKRKGKVHTRVQCTTPRHRHPPVMSVSVSVSVSPPSAPSSLFRRVSPSLAALCVLSASNAALAYWLYRIKTRTNRRSRKAAAKAEREKEQQKASDCADDPRDITVANSPLALAAARQAKNGHHNGGGATEKNKSIELHTEFTINVSNSMKNGAKKTSAVDARKQDDIRTMKRTVYCMDTNDYLRAIQEAAQPTTQTTTNTSAAPSSSSPPPSPSLPSPPPSLSPFHWSGCSVLTSVPDVSETGLALPRWRLWFSQVVEDILRRVDKENVAIFYQTDIKQGGEWVSKAFMCMKAAEKIGMKLVWHKVKHTQKLHHTKPIHIAIESCDSTRLDSTPLIVTDFLFILLLLLSDRHREQRDDCSRQYGLIRSSPLLFS